MDDVVWKKIHFLTTHEGCLPEGILPELLRVRPGLVRVVKSIQIHLSVDTLTGGVLQCFDNLPEFLEILAEQFDISELIFSIYSVGPCLGKFVRTLKNVDDPAWFEVLRKIGTRKLGVKVTLYRNGPVSDTIPEMYCREITSRNREVYSEDLTEEEITEWNEEIARRRSVNEKEFQAQIEAILLPPKPSSELADYVDQRPK